MAENIRILRIKFSRDKITFIKSDTSSSPAPFKQEGVKLELTVSRIFHKALNKTRVEGVFEKVDFEFLGSILFKILCLGSQEDARDFVYNELSFVLRSEKSRELIILDFSQDASQLAVLPWEYLQIMGNNEKGLESFYAGARKDMKFDLVRFIDDAKNDGSKDYSTPENKKLVIVRVISSPLDMPVDQFELEESFEKLNKKFNKNGESTLEIWQIVNPSEKSFYLELEKVNFVIDSPYILHFFGHARMNKEEPEIAFVDEGTGKASWIGCEIFENYFAQEQSYKQPQVVVLQACESGQVNSSGDGLAVNLVRKGIPFVVAMQNEVTQEKSIAFFEKFYHALLSGEDIFRAITMGRVYLGCEYKKKNPNSTLEHYNDNAFGTSVIFSSTIVPISFLPKAEKKETQQEHLKLKCSVCGYVYPYNQNLEVCFKDRCRGKLEQFSLQSTSVAGAGSNQGSLGNINRLGNATGNIPRSSMQNNRV